MTREQSWQVEGATLTLLQHVETLGYVVSVHRLPRSLLGEPGLVEMHAVGPRTDPATQHVAKVSEAEGGETDYRCACLLAEAVGIDLEDG